MRQGHLNIHPHPHPPPQATHTLPVEQHCPAVVALSWSHPDGCHILGHIHLFGLVGPGHAGAREGQTERLQQWLRVGSRSSAGQAGAVPDTPPALLRGF